MFSSIAVALGVSVKAMGKQKAKQSQKSADFLPAKNMKFGAISISSL
jgi:hypothetical protein